MSYVKNDDEKISAIIPVRKGSTRCKNKNIRNFEDTNLLKLKIETLKKVKGIDEIIVSTDCDNMIEQALKLNVKVHKRDVYYASSECPNYEYWTHIAKNVGVYDNFMMINAVSPLIDIQTIQRFVETFFESKLKNMVTVNKQQRFFCNSITKNGINFNSNKTPNSQELIPLSEITFGICIATRKDIIKYKCIYGKNPIFFDLDDISSIDIDTNSDFIKAELLYKNNILNENLCKMILEKRTDKIKLLDCTIRDGGYRNNWEFSDEEVLDCYKAVSEADYEYFEIGFRSNKKLLKNKGKWCYSKEKHVNNIFKKYNGCKIAVMAKIGTLTIDDFIKKDKSNVTMVRVLLARNTQENGKSKSYYSKLDIRKAKTFCQQLIDYGYEVTMNLGCGDIINDDEIKIIASEFHNVKIRALYLADTYGGFNTQNIPIQLHKFYYEFNKYKSNIPFGLHCHNNNEDALEKTKTAIYHGCTMIDSCIGGLGRGAGNLKSEQLISYLYKDKKTMYIKRITPIIVYFDKHILSKIDYQKNLYGVFFAHPYYMISGTLSLHPNYITEILSMNTNLENDIELIVNLDKYTRENNERNYDKNLIKRLNIKQQELTKIRKQKVIITYSCYNPHLCLLESIQSLYDLQITTKYDYKIICIDNGSNILSTYDIIKNRFPLVEIIYTKNENFEYGAYKYALKNFPNFDIYFCLQDTTIIKKQIDLKLIKNNCTYTFGQFSGFRLHKSIRTGDSYDRLMKNINLDMGHIRNIIDSNFNIARHNMFIITKSDLHDLFETLTNPPIKGVDTNFYERLFGMYFIVKKIKTINIKDNISKVPRYIRAHLGDPPLQKSGKALERFKKMCKKDPQYKKN
tara:strand:- start:13431 stop:15992 length:2562 start_codon:yes stop_codon:yes gene_type:complete